MQTALLEMPKGACVSLELGTLGALFEPSPDAEINLVSSEERLIKELISVLEKQLLAVLDTRSTEEFAKVREEVWPKYIRALRALSDTMSNLASAEDFERRTELVDAVITADLEKQRNSRFGNSLVNQATFTLWTLGKIRSLGRKMFAAGNPRDKKADEKLHSEYQVNSLWAQFHLDSVLVAMKFRKSLPEEIQLVICEGLRAAVNAYAVMKDALALRTHPALVDSAAPAAILPWDEEDDQLLAASMKDINADLSDSD
jgi:hypothetical protein